MAKKEFTSAGDGKRGLSKWTERTDQGVLADKRAEMGIAAPDASQVKSQPAPKHEIK